NATPPGGWDRLRRMSETSGSGRRMRIVELLREGHRPITGSELSLSLGVSRQAIVNDMAILRAAGDPIDGSPQGYHSEGDPPGGTSNCSGSSTRGEPAVSDERRVTDSGIELRTLYEPRDLDRWDPDDRLGDPGAFPFTRGPYASMYRGRLWTMRQYAGLGPP